MIVLESKSYNERLKEMLRELEDTYYSHKDKDELNKFILNYSSDDFSKIEFIGNGKQGKELADDNDEFRDKVAVYYILHCRSDFNIKLCRDIYNELAKFAEAASWGANELICLLGEILLNNKVEENIIDFLKGVFTTFDTYGCCISIKLDSATVDNIVYVLNQYEIDLDADDVELKKLLKDGKEYIQGLEVKAY